MEEEIRRLAKSSQLRKESIKHKEMRSLQGKADQMERERLVQSRKEERAQERREAKEQAEKIKSLEAYYNNQIALLNDQLKTEKFESDIAETAQRKEQSRMRQEIRSLG